MEREHMAEDQIEIPPEMKGVEAAEKFAPHPGVKMQLDLEKSLIEGGDKGVLTISTPTDEGEITVDQPKKEGSGMFGGLFGRGQASEESVQPPSVHITTSEQLPPSERVLSTEGWVPAFPQNGPDIIIPPERVEAEPNYKRANVLIIMEEHAKPARERDRVRLDAAYENLRQIWFKEAEWGPVDEIDRTIKINKQNIKRVENRIPNPNLIQFDDGREMSYRERIRQLRRLVELDRDNQVFITEGFAPRVKEEMLTELDRILSALQQEQQPYIDNFNEYVEEKISLTGITTDTDIADILELERKGLEEVRLDSERIFKKTRELWNDDYGVIRFTGQDRTDVEDALKDFIQFTEDRKGFFDPEKQLANVKRIMDVVTRSAERMGMREEEAAMTADNVVARIIIFLHNEFAKVGNMGATGSLKEMFWKDKGKERIKALFGETEVSGYDPEQLAVALDLLANDGRFTPYFRPFGPNGQFVKHAYAQGYLKDEVEEVFYEEIMRYELKGAQRRLDESEERFRARDDDVRGLNRDSITWQQPREKFRGLFNISAPIRKAGETDQQFKARIEKKGDEALKARKDRAKKAGKLALQLNAFLGHQAEMRGVSIIAQNGDYVHRRRAEKFVKFAIIEEMRRRNISPLKLESDLINTPAGERTPRLTEKPAFKEVVKRALDTIWAQGNSASWQDAEGKILYLEDIIQNEETRLIYDGFVANDFPLRSLITSEKTKEKAEKRLRNPDGTYGEYEHNDFITRTRRIIDPLLEMEPMPHNEYGRRKAAEAIDFTLRTQAEASMAVFERFLNNMDQGSQGAGLLTETRLYDLRGTIANNRIEWVKYAEKLIAYLPEIYSYPMALGCDSTWDVVQIITMNNPKMDTTNKETKYPESFENYTGEIQAAVYKIMAGIRSLLKDNPVPDKGEFEKGMFHEILSSRESLIGVDKYMIQKDTAAADKLVEELTKTLLAKPAALIKQYQMLLSDTRMLEIINPAAWATGIFYDQLIDWLISPEGKNDSAYPQRSKGGLVAYGRLENRITVLSEEDKGVSGTEGTQQKIYQKLKEKMVPLPVPPMQV
ncbi:hypothetical protein A2769_03075 [Candidatus Daviesbacteria bacterium RIFCSPHIGHO2_01_FULL_37_27]|nr:MAG: hypothetical protein A2769_03075 [Candidatus Daviesbacteria bacterium RIFCSPHIGHO2_01_FULL_37_27]OGE45986.1 MAG: hypothetical protein A3B39_04250 [Candidatus Daviesbacteria bacterium RIFCSPLOWO2_01_FULL_37_10]